MARDGEAMRFVADLLDEVQARMVRRAAAAASLAFGQDQLLQSRLALLALGHADHRQVAQSQFAAAPGKPELTCPLPPSMRIRSGSLPSPSTILR